MQRSCSLVWIPSTRETPGHRLGGRGEEHLAQKKLQQPVSLLLPPLGGWHLKESNCLIKI